MAPTHQPNRLRTSTQFQDAFASTGGSVLDMHTPRSLTSFEQMDPYVFGNHTNDMMNYETQKTFATRGDYLRQQEGFTYADSDSQVPHLQKQGSVLKSDRDPAVQLDLGMHLGAPTVHTLMQAVRLGGVKFQHKFAGNEFEVDVTLEGGGKCLCTQPACIDSIRKERPLVRFSIEIWMISLLPLFTHMMLEAHKQKCPPFNFAPSVNRWSGEWSSG